MQNFSERDCEGLLDAMYHCGWHRIQDTVKKIESNIPPLPDNVQTRFHGFNIVGDFSDEYVRIFMIQGHANALENSRKLIG